MSDETRSSSDEEITEPAERFNVASSEVIAANLRSDELIF